MYDELSVESLLDLSHTIAAELFKGKKYPWQVLPEIGDFIMKLGPMLPKEEYDNPAPGVWISKSAKIFPSAHISGPCIIGAGTEVRQCAFIRGKAIIGEGAVVGNSTEIKNSVIFDKVQIPHFNYIGDSILGYASHMGAGAVTSNVKSDKSNVSVRYGRERIDTGMKKFGAVLGTHVEVGCNAVLCPGTVIGGYSNVYPTCLVRGFVPGGHIFKNAEQVIIKK